MQVQDLKDQVGDQATNRSTLPLSIGDTFCRYTVAIGVLTWSLVTPRYWSISLLAGASALPAILGGFVAYRVLIHRSPAADTITYKVWSAWLMSICFLPLFRYLPSFQLSLKSLLLSNLLEKSRNHHAKIIAFSIIIAYLIVVHTLRYRRSIENKNYSTSNATAGELSLPTAQAIYSSLFNTEFPFIFMKGIQLALFRQYAIPSISSVLVRTNRLSCPRKISLRYAETEMLFQEFTFREWGSPSWLEAITKIKAIHACMRKSGVASEEDMLYTLATLATQPVELVRRYEWRDLNDVELCAVGTLYRGISDALEIDYCHFLNLQNLNQLQKDTPPEQDHVPSGLKFYDTLQSWQSSYESKNFAYTPSTQLLATTGTDFLLCSVPSLLKPFFISALSTLMDPPLRSAVGFSTPPFLITCLTKFFFSIRRVLLLYFSLPRPEFLRTKRTVDVIEPSQTYHSAANAVSKQPSPVESNTIKTYRTSYIHSPYFLNPTVWNRYLSPSALWYRLLSLPLPGDGDGMIYRSSGYTASAIGIPSEEAGLPQIKEEEEAGKEIVVVSKSWTP
ncbi:hypothetical protein BOTCAL_1183g00020 [Botryotinia calthae]|uniref:ER-bound oxygenase mpaB/mpaB'/Rubber oxygenase catalytic domain-containing protein n=1 Tax=Botryotinia calthae TaxID=38488 RepID=A0A4Y8CDD6_9HELO|nr:hypothetical protein BOTCAL_1183g00020 [Botryotinia calthae]